MTLLYTEEAPTIPGWYFRRMGGSGGRKRLVELPAKGRWPEHWRKVQNDELAATEASGDLESLEKLKALPESHWLTEWCGPVTFDSDSQRYVLISQSQWSGKFVESVGMKMRTDAELISFALGMWANFIETGDNMTNAQDAANMKRPVKPTSDEQKELILRLRNLASKHRQIPC